MSEGHQRQPHARSESHTTLCLATRALPLPVLPPFHVAPRRTGDRWGDPSSPSTGTFDPRAPRAPSWQPRSVPGCSVHSHPHPAWWVGHTTEDLRALCGVTCVASKGLAEVTKSRLL